MRTILWTGMQAWNGWWSNRLHLTPLIWHLWITLLPDTGETAHAFPGHCPRRWPVLPSLAKIQGDYIIFIPFPIFSTDSVKKRNSGHPAISFLLLPVPPSSQLSSPHSDTVGKMTCPPPLCGSCCLNRRCRNWCIQLHLSQTEQTGSNRELSFCLLHWIFSCRENHI